MSTTGSSASDQLEDIRRRFADDAEFRSAAGADLAGTLRKAGLDDEQLGRFVVSDTDEYGNKGMGLRTETWICEIGEGSKRCWCVTCPIA
jgi:hypothetical protein